MNQERKVQLSVRLPESFAREFRSLCVLHGLSVQEVLEEAAREFVRNKNPE
jgi:hypothetical protein